MVEEIGKEKITIGVPVFKRAPFTFDTLGVPVARGKFKMNEEIVNFEVNVDALGKGIQFIIGGKFYSLNVKEIAICLMNKVVGADDFFEYRFSPNELNILDRYTDYQEQKGGQKFQDRTFALQDMLRAVWDYFELQKLIKEDNKNEQGK